MLWDFLSKAVVDADRGDKVAIAMDDAAVTYGELLQKAEALATRLGALGVGPGQIVLAHLENGPGFLIALFAVARLGAAFAPLDVGLTDAEVAGISKLTQTDLVVCLLRDASRCARFSRNLVCLDAAGDVAEARITSLPARSVDPTIGCVQFTSGTTGAPKGVLLSHEAFLFRAHYLVRALGLRESERTLCALPLSHAHGAECLALPTLLAGGTLYLKSPKFFFPFYILEEIERHRITFFSSVPQFYDFVAKLGPGKSPDISSLRLPFCGSAALAKTTAEAFFARSGVHIKQGYGLVELSVICLNLHDEGRVVYDAVGKPIEGVEWKLAGGEPEGELLVRSKAMFSGYLDNPEATREKVRAGWLHTGDVVRIDSDGLFRIVGRREDFIKVNGLKVYAVELETAIIGLPWIKECAVVAEKDDGGTDRIVAHLVPNDWSLSAAAMEAAVLRHLRAQLSDYKLPKRCIAWRELPKSRLGKILKSRIQPSVETPQ